ncbi:MAG TPA: copper amine oxidase [Candidatus Limnocylindria bacterium]|nr:copper amine oxidase [Candidatus Limnocylindria bacterium]
MAWRAALLAVLVLLATGVNAVHGAVAAGPSARARPVGAPDFNTPAAQLRVTLGRVLAEHAFLLGEAMRAGLGEASGFQAAGAALEQNSAELEGLMADVYGHDVASRFGELWRRHVAYLVDYTRALAEDDQAAQDLAEHQLHDYVTEFSAFLASANPNLPVSALERLVGEHVQQLEAIAAFDAGEYAEAYPTVRETYAHMFVIADGLSEAMALQFPERFTGKSVAYSPAGDLRLNLDRLLGEHTMLAGTAMRAGASDADDRAAAEEALAANTDALGAAVTAIYGEEAGAAFVDLWSVHTAAYLEYVASVQSSDVTGRDEALTALGRYRDEFSAFLADANPQLSAQALREMLGHHTDQLVRQVDAYSAGDHREAYALAREAFSHAFAMGDALALAIAEQFPDRFPDAATRGGWDTSRMGAILVGFAALAMAGQEVSRRRRRTQAEPWPVMRASRT